MIGHYLFVAAALAVLTVAVHARTIAGVRPVVALRHE
jgi:hypothetical protein